MCYAQSLCVLVCPFKQPYAKFALIPAKPDGLTFASCSTASLLFSSRISSPWILFELLVYEVHYSPNVQLTNLSSIYPHVLALFGLEVHPLKLLHRSSTYRSPRFCSTPCWWLPSNLGGCANLSCQREGGFQYKLNFYLEGLVHGMISSKILRPYPKLLNEMSYCFFDSSVAITGIEKTCSG